MFFMCVCFCFNGFVGYSWVLQGCFSDLFDGFLGFIGISPGFLELFWWFCRVL